MNQQQRLFDGQVVEHFKGTLGPFDIEDEEVQHYSADATVVLVVTATVDGAALKRAKDGDWVRTNKLATTSVRVAVGELREELIDLFHLSVTDQLTLPVATIAPPSSTPTSASPSTSAPSPSSPPSPSPSPTPAQPAAAAAPAASAPSTDVEQNGDAVQDTSLQVPGLIGLPTPIQLPKPGDETLRRFLGEA